MRGRFKVAWQFPFGRIVNPRLSKQMERCQDHDDHASHILGNTYFSAINPGSRRTPHAATRNMWRELSQHILA